jgi:hypothetical protein
MKHGERSIMSDFKYPLAVFWSNPDEAFICIAQDLPGYSAVGDTAQEAVKGNGNSAKFRLYERQTQAARPHGSKPAICGADRHKATTTPRKCRQLP